MFVVSAKLVKVAAYLAFVGGLGALCLRLSAFAGETALALAAPHLAAPTTPGITLVERRRIALEQRVAVNVEKQVIPIPDQSSVPLPVLASAMDEAEQTDLIGRPQPRLRKAKARRAEMRVAAADVFGESFGVMLRASR